MIVLVIFSFKTTDFKVQTLYEVDASLAEASGLLHYKDQLITFNDSGNDNKLYVLDKKTGTITRIVEVSNAKNVDWSDWEDITQDDDYIYLGDIGNFYGYRNYMNVHKIKKSDFDHLDVVESETIQFKYKALPERIYNESGIDFDAEAMVHIKGKIYLFTKQWKTGHTALFEIPKHRKKEPYVLQAKHQFKINGLVSGASYNKIKDELYLTGYSKTLQPFLYIYKDFSKTDLDQLNGIKHELAGTGFTCQIEGVTYDEDHIYLISERIEKGIKGFSLVIPGKIYTIPH